MPCSRKISSTGTISRSTLRMPPSARKVTLLSFLSHTLYCLGHLDRSVQTLNERMSISDKLSHPYTQAHALAHVCWTGWLTVPGAKLQSADAPVLLASGKPGRDRYSHGPGERGPLGRPQATVRHPAIGSEPFAS